MAKEIIVKESAFMIALKFIGIGVTALVGIPVLLNFLKERGWINGY